MHLICCTVHYCILQSLLNLQLKSVCTTACITTVWYKVYTIVQFFKYAIKILQNNLNSDFYTKYILKKQSGFGVTVFDMWKRAFLRYFIVKLTPFNCIDDLSPLLFCIWTASFASWMLPDAAGVKSGLVPSLTPIVIFGFILFGC